MDAGKGKSQRFQAFPSPRQPGGSKGYLRRLHFMRPFAPCFDRLVAGAQVYLVERADRNRSNEVWAEIVTQILESVQKGTVIRKPSF
jgi:hypothetical protein